MARLDVYPMPGKSRRGYVLDVQAERLSHLIARTLVPLMPLADAPKPIMELNPVFDIDGEPHVLVTQAIASVSSRERRRPVASLDSQHDEIARALDILLLGF